MDGGGGGGRGGWSRGVRKGNTFALVHKVKEGSVAWVDSLSQILVGNFELFAQLQ